MQQLAVLEREKQSLLDEVNELKNSMFKVLGDVAGSTSLRIVCYVELGHVAD